MTDNMETAWIEWVSNSIHDMQAARVAQSTMIEAMLMAHPDPEGLREAWHRLSSGRMAAGALDHSTKGRQVDADLLHHLKAWSDRLDRYHPPAA